MMQRFLAGLALAAVLASAQAGVAKEIGSRAAVTPLPMRFFCSSHPAECRPDRTASVILTRDLMDTLQSVNRRVNNAIRPKANPRGGWKVGPAAGDCNDFAITKRSHLIGMGVPAGSLRLAVTSTRRGEPHLVLIVRTNEADLVLDNLAGSVRTLPQSGYRISAMSSTDPQRWVAG